MKSINQDEPTINNKSPINTFTRNKNQNGHEDFE